MTQAETITLTRTTDGDTPVAEFVVPRQLGSVRLLREIGRGGMGVVWLGHDELLDRDVAVKFLLNAVAGPDDPGFVRFIAGARAAAAVRHAGLTAIHHADMVAGIPYIVMEYVEGPTLSDVRKRCGPLSAEDVGALLEAVADAVGELHEHDIVHQDIKPANVLLDGDGQAFVTDFGLSHVRPPLGSGPTTERLAGTPAYMAPEMLDGHVTVRSDVYALGVMAYELLSGELPYTGTLAEVQSHHRGTPLPAGRLKQRQLAPELIDVLERAAHKDAVYRYKTARHFLRALRAACPDAPSGAAAQRRRAILVTRRRGAGADSAAGPDDQPTPTSYYDTLAARAAAKRGQTPPLDDVSPEASVPAPETIQVGDALTFDLPCVGCGYNARGLSPQAQCPACGTPLATSLHPERLLFADRRWLRRLRRGQTLILTAMAVYVLGLVAHFLIGGAEPWLTGIDHSAAASATWASFELLAALLLTMGAWLSVSTHRATFLTREQYVWGWLGRLTVTLYVLMACAYGVQLVTRAPGQPVNVVLRAYLPVMMFATPIGLWMFIQGLAHRVPNKPAARATRLGAALFGVMAFVLLAFAIGAGESAPGIWRAAFYLALFVVYGIVMVRVTWRARRMLHDELRVELSPEVPANATRAESDVHGVRGGGHP